MGALTRCWRRSAGWEWRRGRARPSPALGASLSVRRGDVRTQHGETHRMQGMRVDSSPITHPAPPMCWSMPTWDAEEHPQHHPCTLPTLTPCGTQTPTKTLRESPRHGYPHPHGGPPCVPAQPFCSHPRSHASARARMRGVPVPVPAPVPAGRWPWRPACRSAPGCRSGWCRSCC